MLHLLSEQPCCYNYNIISSVLELSHMKDFLLYVRVRKAIRACWLAYCNVWHVVTLWCYLHTASGIILYQSGAAATSGSSKLWVWGEALHTWYKLWKELSFDDFPKLWGLRSGHKVPAVFNSFLPFLYVIYSLSLPVATSSAKSIQNVSVYHCSLHWFMNLLNAVYLSYFPFLLPLLSKVFAVMLREEQIAV